VLDHAAAQLLVTPKDKASDNPGDRADILGALSQ
jgi:hypothetical protein